MMMLFCFSVILLSRK